MKQITLTGGHITTVDDDWYPVLAKWSWHLSVKGYAQRAVRAGKTVFMHQIIAMTPTGLQTDHVNGDKLDNREANLRHCTNAENCRARKFKAGASGYRGVRVSGRKFTAVIMTDYKMQHLGTFESAEDAARAYDSAAKEQHRHFATLNFPNDTA